MKARALQWLAQREQSRAELRRKLMRHAVREAAAQSASVSASASASGRHGREASVDPPFEPEAASQPATEPVPAATRVDAVLDWLEAHQYLSQARFVESRVHARSERFGNLRIQQELRQHQVALPADTAQALKDSELQRARSVRARKFPEPPSNAAERGRQARFLAGRGFSADVIRRVLREADRPDADADFAGA